MEKIGNATFSQNYSKPQVVPQEFYLLFSELKKIGEFILRSLSPEVMDIEIEKYRKRAKKLSTNYFIPSLEMFKNYPDIQHKKMVLEHTAAVDHFFSALGLGDLLHFQKAQRTVSKDLAKEMLPFIREYVELTYQILEKMGPLEKKEEIEEALPIQATAASFQTYHSIPIQAVNPPQSKI